MLDKIKNFLSGKKEVKDIGPVKRPAPISKRVSSIKRKLAAKNSTKVIPIGVKKFLADKKASIGPQNMRPRNIGTSDEWNQKKDKFHRTIEGRRSYATPRPALDFTYKRKHSNE